MPDRWFEGQSRSTFGGLWIAVTCAALAQVARVPVHAGSIPFIIYVPFIVLSAALGGLWPGLLTTSLCAMESVYFVLEPAASARDPQTWYGLGALMISGVVVSLVAGHLRRAERSARAAHQELAAMQGHSPVRLVVLDENLQIDSHNTGERDGRPDDGLRVVVALAETGEHACGPACSRCSARLALLDSARHGTAVEGLEVWMLPQEAGKQRRCYRISATPIEYNRSRKILVCVEDVTERNRTEIELERKAALIDLSRDAIIRTDTTGAIRGWNRGAEETYGWNSADATGRMIHTMLATRGATPVAEITASLILNGRWDGELLQTRRDGETMIIESRQVLMRDEAGAPVDILEINRDITGRKLHQRELVIAHRRTSVILESISDGFTALNREWRFTYMNTAAAQMLKTTPQQQLGRTFWEHWPHASDSAIGQALRRAAAQNTPVQVEAFYPEPLNAWFEMRCYPSAEGLSLFFTNTTERHRAEDALRQGEARERTRAKELEQALVEKTVLLKEVHHRVKNNLAMISSLLGMQADGHDNEGARAALEKSQQRVQSIALIHEHLYAAAHLDRIDFKQYAHELVTELGSAFLEEQQRISILVEADPLEFSVNLAIPCGLILNELISNALKYAFPDARCGEIRIGCRQTAPGMVQLGVEDNGVGMPGNFDWRRTDSLGLQIVQILARQIDAKVEVSNGAGTRFELTFPTGARLARTATA